MANKWDSLSKPERAKLLAGAGLPTGLAQLNWSGLQKSERKKLKKGKGWFEAKEPIMTAKGIEHLAPEHHKVAIKKEAGKALNKRMERKEDKTKTEELMDSMYLAAKRREELQEEAKKSSYKTIGDELIEKTRESILNSIKGAKTLQELNEAVNRFIPDGISKEVEQAYKKKQGELERKEPIASKKPKEEWKQFNEELRVKSEQENQHKKEQYLTTEPEFIIVKPNSHRALERIDTELNWKDNDYIEWKQYDVPLPIGSYRAFDGRYYIIPKIIDISKIKGLNIVKELPERAQLTFHKNGGKVLHPIKKEELQKATPIPASVLSEPQGIKRETEATLLNRENLDFYYTRPNGHKDKVMLNAENNLVGAKLAFNEWNEANEATVYKILPHQTAEDEKAGYKNHPKFDWLKSTEYPIEFPIIFDNEKTSHQPETPQGIKLDADEEKFVRGIHKQASEGATVKEFGTRLYVWKDNEAYATKHITDSEYRALKAIIKGVHQVSRADALKNLKEGREKEAKIAQEIEERKAQELRQPETPKKAQNPVLKELEPLVIEAQKKGLYYLNDIKDYVSTKTGIPKEELGGRIYDILKEQEKDKPNLVEQITENLKKQELVANQSGTQSKYESFLNTTPDMERGKAKKTLNTQINYEGNVMSRREFVEKKAAGGGKVVSRKERMYKKEEALKEKLDVMWKTVPFGNSEYPATKEYNRLKAELEAGIHKEILTIQTSDTEFVEVTKTEADYFNYLTGHGGN